MEQTNGIKNEAESRELEGTRIKGRYEMGYMAPMNSGMKTSNTGSKIVQKRKRGQKNWRTQRG